MNPEFILSILGYSLIIIIGMILSVNGAKYFTGKHPVIRKESQFSQPYDASEITRTEKTSVSAYISPYTRRTTTQISKRTYKPNSGTGSPNNSIDSTINRRRFSGKVEDLNWGRRSRENKPKQTQKRRRKHFTCPYCEGDVVKNICIECGRTYSPEDYWI